MKQKKGKFENVVTAFLSKELHPMIAEPLVQKYKSLAGIGNMESLSEEKQLSFVDTLINSVLGRVRTKKQLEVAHFNFFVTWATLEASGALTDLHNRNVDIKTNDLEMLSETSLLEAVELLSHEVFVTRADFSGAFNATAYILLFKEGVISLVHALSRDFLENSEDSDKAKKEKKPELEMIDEQKCSVVNEFVRSIVASYGSVVSRISKSKLSFDIPVFDPLDLGLFVQDIKNAAFSNNAEKCEKIFSSKFSLVLDSKNKFEGMVFFIIKKNSGSDNNPSSTYASADKTKQILKN